MLISSLLSSFGLILRGIYTGHDNTLDTVCPQTGGLNASFDDCIKVVKCQLLEIGIYPNCSIPQCPPQYTGTYPKCKTQSNESKCPIGSVGEFPMCDVRFTEVKPKPEEPKEDYALSEGYPTITFATELPTTSQIPTQVSDEMIQFSPLPQTSPAQTSQNEVEVTSALPKASTEQPTTENCGTGSHGKSPNCMIPLSPSTTNFTKGSKSKKCGNPYIGVYPDCFIPPCPPQYSGTYPECIKPTDRVCPKGTIGKFPNCMVTSSASASRKNCELSSMHSSTVPPPNKQTTNNGMEWNNFKRTSNKTYDNQTEEQKSQQIFHHNQEIVKGQNERFELDIETDRVETGGDT